MEDNTRTITLTEAELDAIFLDLEANIEDTIRGTSPDLDTARKYYIEGARQMALRVYLGKPPIAYFSSAPLPGMSGFRR